MKKFTPNPESVCQPSFDFSEIEEWKTAVKDGIEYPFYQVSNFGNVRRRMVSGRARSGDYRLLSPKLRRHGYLSVTLAHKSELKYVSVHRLVAEAFIGSVADGLQINHIDGVKTNNHISNLEIVTPKRNYEHAVEHGLYDPHHLKGKVRPEFAGTKNPNAKLSEEQISELRRVYSSAVKKWGIASQFARQYNVTSTCISYYLKDLPR